MCIRDRARLLKERVLELEGDPDQVFHVSLPGDGADLFRSVLDTTCLLYTSDAADERSSVDLGGRRIIKKKKIKQPRAFLLYTL